MKDTSFQVHSIVNNFNEYYNYIHRNRNFCFSELSLSYSIDYVRIFVSHLDLPLDTAWNIIRSFSTRHQHKRNLFYIQCLVDGAYYRLTLRLVFINNMYFGTSLTLHHPSSRFVNFIEFTFKVAYRISEVEFSIDIISSDQLSLLRLLQITSYIKNPGKAVSLAYNETTYLNDNRKSSTKGAKIYHKKDEFGEPVRLEMRMKRRYFQKRNINKMSTALSLSAEMIFSDWTFKMFELKKFMKKTLVNHEDKEVMIILNQFQGRLFEVGFFSAFNSNEDGGGVRIVRKYVKDFNVDPDSCFTSLPFEKDFFKVISGNKFII